jgi:AcrR family transcriptional regulator
MGLKHDHPAGAGVTGAPLAERDCETRRAILEAARKRFLHYGYKKTTIDEIAADAGVGKGTVYLYFGSKDDVLTTIAAEVKRNVTEQMRAIAGSPMTSPEEKLRRMVLAGILAVHDAYTSTAHGIELLDASMELRLTNCGQCEREAQLGLLAGVLREGVRLGDFALPGDDADAAARHLALAFAAFYPPYSRVCPSDDARCKVSMRSRVERMSEFVFAGIRRRSQS